MTSCHHSAGTLPQLVMQQRLEKLEMLMMEQDNTIDILNREVLHQRQHILQLEQQLEHLKMQIAALQKDEHPPTPNTEDEPPPPHY